MLADYKFKPYFIFITYLKGLNFKKMKKNPQCKIISDNVSSQRMKQVLSAIETAQVH